MSYKTQDQITDIFTKVLKYDVFKKMKEKIGIVVT